ncbi:MAG: NGG1p interacting factor NIF3 [Candidatus Staskawiczbacteria bacterium]|nr:NGG1p interacting factor NIF3 [Candidatus Staskawiczbacteria bacterium]
MKIQDIFNLALKMGIESDFRGKEGVQKLLDNKKKIFDKLSEKDKEDFDKDALENPYLDSAVYNISDDKEIKKVMVGIDIAPGEIMMAKELGDIDLVIAHHPVGKGLAQLADVMHLQADVYNYYGVPINVAEGLMKERISEVARGVNASNHQRTVDSSKKPETVGEIISILKEIPEYKEAGKIGVGPKIFVGATENRCGKIAMSEITGGTEGSPKMYEKMAQAGIGTSIAMHISEEHKKEAEAAHVNIVIAGHISSDSLGVNLFMDELEKQRIEIVSCSGFTRFSRI